MTTLTDAGLARLEELAEPYLSGDALPFAESAYRESACNAVPSLVAEVRRLREAKTISLCDIREQLESEQAKTITALRERVEALEKMTDWLAQAAANNGWNGYRVSAEDMKRKAEEDTK